MDSQSVESKLPGCLFNTRQSTNEDKQQWMVQEPILCFKISKQKEKNYRPQYYATHWTMK